VHKLAIVAAPLIVYLVALAVRRAIGRMPNRHAINVETSVLLVVYLFVTAGLGVFWVANQQLPPFDWHYLFGYLTVTLIAVHLFFNLRIVWRHVRRGAEAKPAASGNWASTGRVVLVAAAIVAAFFAGTRAGSTELKTAIGGAPGEEARSILDYHAFSSHTRGSVVLRAPSVSWGENVPPYLDRSRLHALPLPRPQLGRAGEAPPRGAAPTVDDLSILLWSAAGITERRGGLELRAAASSGALFPTEVYAVVRMVSGVEPGVYAYDPRNHALARVREGAPSMASLGAADAGEPPITLVFTCVFRRSGQKYRDRAYRYAVADAGHVIGNVVEAASAIDVGTRLLPRFDDAKVASAVGADGEEEGVVAALAVGPGIPPAIAPSVLVARSTAPIDGLALGATGLAHASTSLELAPLTSRAEPAVALPPLEAPAPNALALIERRRSVREYADRPLTLREVAGVLRRGHAREPSLSRATRTHVIANRVQGLARGVYRYDPATGGLALAREGAFGADAGRAGLDQEVIAGAALTVAVSFDRATLRAEGARAYRQAFLEAGMIGARLYLGAGAEGLGGCSVGAFYDEELAALLGVSTDVEWPAHLFALGPPPG
jgi:SagB-type dehydrogenase family enzyme